MFPVILLFDYHGNCQNYSTLLGLNFFTITLVFLHVEGRSVCWSPVTVGGCYDKIRKRLGFQEIPSILAQIPRSPGQICFLLLIEPSQGPGSDVQEDEELYFFTIIGHSQARLY